MIITNLVINQLYGKYNYSVSFNKDVTFLYGLNGCGKTTVLNIIAAIVSGNVQNLLRYTFNYIELHYEDSKGNNDRTIFIQKKSEGMHVDIGNQIFHLVDSQLNTPIGIDDMENRDDEAYLLSNSLKSIFNYVYLPLSRTVYENSDMAYENRVGRDFYFDNGHIKKMESAYSKAMKNAEELIRNNYRESVAHIARINDDFRNDILKSLLETDTRTEMEDIFQKLFESEETIKDIHNTKVKYLELLDSLNIKSDDKDYGKFFDDFAEVIEEHKNESTIPSYIAFMYQEFARAKTLIPLTEKMEERKKNSKKSIDLFTNIMNDFISYAEKKEIRITESGKVLLSYGDAGTSISVEKMSSGEKQLLVFFSHLIFGVKERKETAIFIMDEPELSLHLSWQKKFVEAALKANENVQLVFATHSPEIIGRYRDKMVKLEKNIVGE